jgi:putative flippase GtrA
MIESRGLQQIAPATTVGSTSRLRALAAVELRRTGSWLQLLSFCLVGSTGYVVNLAVYAALLSAGVGFVAAAVTSFLVAVANNYALNRAVTFRHRRGSSVPVQGARYLSVSLLGLTANVALLMVILRGGVPPLAAQACAIVLVTPLSFVGNKLWSFRD